MTGSVLAWVNAVKTATLTASSATAALPVTNLANDQGSPSAAWQTVDGVRTGVVLTITPAARTTFRALGVFRTNRTSAGTVAYAVKTNPGPVTVASGNLIMAGMNGLAILSADTPGDIVTFTFNDGANPDNHLNIPLALAGPAWLMATAIDFSSAIGLDDVTDEVVSRGGQRYIDNRAVGRRWELGLSGVRQSELWVQLDPVDRASRLGGNILVVPDIASANIASEAAFGTLKATSDISYPYGNADRRGWRARLLERL